MMPNNIVTPTPVVSPFLAPRQGLRFSSVAGLSDLHYGGIALGDPSQGLKYQLWRAYSDGYNIWLTAANTPPFIFMPNVNATWVALAFDQNARIFLAWTTASGAGFYYWFSTLLNAFTTSVIPGTVHRVFAALDDQRPATISGSDVLLIYPRSNQLIMRVQRDRFGVEYNLGAPPAPLVQVGMNLKYRFQFAFQNSQNNTPVPPDEYTLPPGVNPPS